MLICVTAYAITLGCGRMRVFMSLHRIKANYPQPHHMRDTYPQPHHMHDT